MTQALTEAVNSLQRTESQVENAITAEQDSGLEIVQRLRSDTEWAIQQLRYELYGSTMYTSREAHEMIKFWVDYLDAAIEARGAAFDKVVMGQREILEKEITEQKTAVDGKRSAEQDALNEAAKKAQDEMGEKRKERLA